MNERIRELRKQAWKEAYNVDPDDPRIARAHKAMEEGLEKFAELIVREMCQVMKAEGEQFSLDQNFDAVKGVGRCMRKVKEHFGVQE